MALLRRVIVCALLALLVALCASPGVAHAQRSHYQRQERLRRLAADRDRAGDREETRRLREEHCAEVGPAQCERERQRSSREFAQLFVFPALRWIVGGMLAIGAFLWWRTRGGRRRAIGAARVSAKSRGSTSSSLDLVVIDLALEPAAAQQVRAAIDRAVARSVSIESVLRDVARALLLARGGWTHAAVRSWPIATSGDGEDRYHALVKEARGRATLEPSALREPGAGYRGGPAAAGDHVPVIMASLTVCSLDEIPERGGAVADAASAVLLALESLPPQRVYRADLTWLPDGSDEALSAAELLARHPRLIAIARPRGEPSGIAR